MCRDWLSHVLRLCVGCGQSWAFQMDPWSTRSAALGRTHRGCWCAISRCDVFLKPREDFAALLS